MTWPASGSPGSSRPFGGARAPQPGLLGTEHEVLAERVAKRGEGEIQARTRDFKTVVLRAGAAVLGGYYRVKLTGTTGSTFTGTVATRFGAERRCGALVSSLHPGALPVAE